MFIVVHESSLRKSRLQAIKDNHHKTVQTLTMLAPEGGIWVHAKDGSMKKMLHLYDANPPEQIALAAEGQL